MNEEIRLNKHLALQLGISRREADDLIANKKVIVNGEAAALGHRITASDKVVINKKTVKTDQKLQYMILNKPVGYVCSRKQQDKAPTIYQLLPSNLYRLKPVGRLDKDSSGLLILTNDGDFAHKMTHPKFHKTKTYEISLNKGLEPLHQQMINDRGVDLEDGKSQLALSRLSEENRKDWQVNMHEGRNRQIRRTFEAMGYQVVKLHRITFGDYSLGDMKPGEYHSINIR